MRYKVLIKQINNLKIYHELRESLYVVFAPNGRALEEFNYLHNAENFCKETKDFIKNKA